MSHDSTTAASACRPPMQADAKIKHQLNQKLTFTKENNDRNSKEINKRTDFLDLRVLCAPEY